MGYVSWSLQHYAIDSIVVQYAFTDFAFVVICNSKTSIAAIVVVTVQSSEMKISQSEGPKEHRDTVSYIPVLIFNYITNFQGKIMKI